MTQTLSAQEQFRPPAVHLSKPPLPTLVNRYDDVHRIVEMVYESGELYSYDFETLGRRPQRLRVAGLGFAWGHQPGEGSYIMTAHQDYPTLDWERVLAIVKPLLEDPTMTAVAHNQLFDATILDRFGVELHTNTGDTMVMNWLLNTDSTNGLKDIVHRIYGHKMTELKEFCAEETVSWHPGKILRLDKAPIDKLSAYAVEDVLWTYRLYQDELRSLGRRDKLPKIYSKLYQRFLRVLSGLEADGIAIDTALMNEMAESAGRALGELSVELLDAREGQDFDPALMTHLAALSEVARSEGRELTEFEREEAINKDRKAVPELNKKWSDKKNLRDLLYAHPERAHKVYNLKSNKQLNVILFEELGLSPNGEKTAQGIYKVDAKALLKLVPEDPSGYVKAFLRYRKLQKLHSQYLVGLTPLLDDDGRLRTSFNPALKTGRLSSSQPNLQNIINLDEYPVRKAFVPRPGFSLIVSDYSQIELRVLAHVSQDPSLVEGFKQGFDPHSITTSKIFPYLKDVPLEAIKDQYKKERKLGKLMNFAVVYGVGATSLAEQIADATDGELVPSVKEAQGFIDTLLREMPGVKRYLDRTAAQAKRDGVVHTLTGRPRHLPQAQNPNDRRFFFGALRRAGNSPIQGTAADIIALAMCDVADEFRNLGLWRKDVFMLLQVHDELIFEVRQGLEEQAIPIIQRCMEQAVTLRVPLEAEPVVCPTWYDGK